MDMLRLRNVRVRVANEERKKERKYVLCAMKERKEGRKKESTCIDRRTNISLFDMTSNPVTLSCNEQSNS